MDPEIEKLLEGYRLAIDWPVMWRDIDMLRHVNNVVYFKWFEQARAEYGARAGTVSYAEKVRFAPILRDSRMEFRRAITYPDTVTIGIRVAVIERDRYNMEIKIVSNAQKAVAADGGGTLVYFDYENQTKMDLPEELIEKIESFEGRPLKNF